jgi:PAS domain S-box-containing protein
MSEFDEVSPKSKLSAHEQRAETEALFTSIGDGAISTDEFGRITRVNPAAQQLLGFSEAELLGAWFPKKIMAVNFDDQPITLIDRPITKAFLTGKPVSEKISYRRKDGRKIALSVNISPIILNGKPLGAIEVFRDITLEQEVDKMKSEFISLASHQLRTPLSATKTYTHMLYDGYMGKLNPAQKKALSTIISATNRMNELISTLLNVTRIESGNIEVTPKLLHIDKLAEEVIKEVSLMASNKSIQLSLTVKGKASTGIKTDSLIVKEVMTNLISNAIKYTPDNGRVELIIHPRKDTILVEVHDTGWGIPKYSHEQVFSKFFRAQNIVQRETTGTGLGLYLVKGLLEALGGKIWFTSEEEKGTKFSFTLPRKQKFPIRIRSPESFDENY